MSFAPWGDHYSIDLPGARAVFTTRRGGCSEGPYESLNLGLLTADECERVRANRESLSAGLGISLAYARQVHGAEVRRVDAPNHPATEPPAADGVATATPGIGVLALTADCLPIAIAGGGAVAVVHAGWQGLAGGVIAAGVQAVRELGRGGLMAAAIGPAAGACCYEVGDELRDRFAGYGAEVRRARKLDLKLIARRQLEAAGIEEVADAGLCTICAGESLFFSHRRDHGVTGRQAGIAWLT